MITRIVLVGLSGSGKSTVGSLLAVQLGWNLIDTDAEIERREGRSIPSIFDQSGEAAFRKVERQVLREALNATSAVIATGGGAVVNDRAWTDEWLVAADTLTVWLDAPPEVLLARLEKQQRRERRGTLRPLLQGDDPLANLKAMGAHRESYYRRATIHIPGSSIDLMRIVDVLAEAARPGRVCEIALDVPGGASRIQVGDGIKDRVAATISARWPSAGTVWVISDMQVARHHLGPMEGSLVASGLAVRSATFAAGEASKSLEGVRRLYDAMLTHGIERSDVVVALGGGVTGDLVGFAAATVLRGVGLMQVPTSLLAMVDSSVGGKTGINHETGKNLIGAFYQPAEVIVDPMYLRTLPAREYRAGWAEIIKHGLIEVSSPAGDSGLLELIESNASSLLDGSSPLLAGIIARNVEIKASVVQADEREAGLRAILNFGHTIGHAVEAAGYRLLHGEAVAVGLHGAMRLAVELGRIETCQAERVRDLLASFGLPVTVDADVDAVRAKMARDKKRVAGSQQWVLPIQDGGVDIAREVSDEAVDAALQAVITSRSA